MSQQLWPWRKIEDRLKTTTLSGRTPAVLFASGHLSPTHKGHVLMLHQAEDRLKRLGYDVLGGWLSPAHDLAVLADAKKRGVPELGHDFRLYLAEQSVTEDPFVSVSSFEASCASIPTDQDTGRALYIAANEKFGPQFPRDKIRVFCVCGCDHMAEFKLKNGFGSTQLGVVVVPRENTDEILLEKPSMLVFVADSTPGEAAALSSTQLRQAIIDGNREYVKNAMVYNAARCVLQPTLQEQQLMRTDFEHLGSMNPALDIISTDGAWPHAQFAKKFAQLQPQDVPAVLIVSGSMSPVHNGHFEVMRVGRERLERAGYKVLVGYLSPQNATGAAAEMRSAEGADNEVALSTGFRLKTTKLAVSNDDFVYLGAWEASVMGRVARPHDVMRDLSESLAKSVPGLRERLSELRIFYACDPGQASRRGLNKAIGASDKGIVIVPRADEDCFLLEKPCNLFFITDPTECEASIVVAAKIRAALLSGNADFVNRNVPAAVARFILSPTASELAAMQEDFAALRPQALGGSARLTDGASADKAQEKFKAVLRAWAGPNGCVGIEDVARLLQALDPSWTNSEISTFSSGAFGAVSKGGEVSCDALVDWMFMAGN